MPEFQLMAAGYKRVVPGGKHPAGLCPMSAQNARLCGKPTSRADGQLTVQNGGSGAEQTGTWVAERGGIALAATCPAR